MLCFFIQMYLADRYVHTYLFSKFLIAVFYVHIRLDIFVRWQGYAVLKFYFIVAFSILQICEFQKSFLEGDQHNSQKLKNKHLF